MRVWCVAGCFFAGDGEGFHGVLFLSMFMYF